MRIAFLGCGKAAQMHTKTLRKVAPEVTFAYASRQRERAERFCRDLGGEAAFGSYAAATEDPGVDAVFVVTPPSSHLELTLRALEAKRHVLVEKPAFLKAADFDRAAAAAKRAGRRILVAENYYYKPLRYRLERLLADRVIGDPICLYVNALKQQGTEGWRDDPALSGGGALFEGGIHWVNLMANLGLPAASSRSLACGERPLGRERSAVVTLEYEGGAVGTLFYSWDVPSPLGGLRVSRVYGTRGSIVFESNGLFVGVYGEKKRIYLPGLRDIAGYRAMFRDFVGALGEDREPEMTLDLARRDVELLQSATPEPAPAASPSEQREDAASWNG